MALLRRQRVAIISLVFYWSAIFVLTHIPIPGPPIVLKTIVISDKALHYLVYLLLVFLLWFAVSPYKKVNWRRATVWWILFIVVWYGAFDQWLQGYVGRSPEVMDFFADLAGVLTGLVLLSIFPFWPASLVVIGAVIFVLTNFMHGNLAELFPVTSAAFHFFAYGFFSLLWIQCMYRLLPLRVPEPRWLIGALALPMLFLLSVELFLAVTGNDFRLSSAIISAVGVVAVAAGVFLTALFRRSSAQKRSLGGFERPV